MRPPFALSSCVIADDTPVVRDTRRPPDLRNSLYDEQYDWKTLFYDVYRVGTYTVFQGPPFLNFLPSLRSSAYFSGSSGGFWPRVRIVERHNASEIWLRDARSGSDAADMVDLVSDLGSFCIPVQPNLSDIFTGRRVLHTLSKNNDIRWIKDWIQFYARVHGADAILFYDNNSTVYQPGHLQHELETAFPDLAIVVQDWPFKYGPQGGMAGAVNGVEAPWDSDFCQTGSLQHARFRYLQSAKSVLNVDIDELVLSDRDRSIFAATEKTWRGFIKFDGFWISSAADRSVTAQNCRHQDFHLRNRDEQEQCPPKWCVVPRKTHPWKHSWSVHNLFGARANRHISREFHYRHMRAITNNWKYDRWEEAGRDPERFYEDDRLRDAFGRAGLLP